MSIRKLPVNTVNASALIDELVSRSEVIATAAVDQCLAVAAQLEGLPPTGDYVMMTATERQTIAAHEASLSDVSAGVSSLEASLSNILVDVIFKAGQQSDFAGLGNTSSYNSKSYAVSSEPGKLVSLSVFTASGNGTVAAKVFVGYKTGNDITITNTANVTVNEGFNTFTVDLIVPSNGVIGIQSTGNSLYFGANSQLPAIPFWYSSSTVSSFTGTVLNGSIMLEGVIEQKTDSISGTIATLSNYIQTVRSKMIGGIDFVGNETTTTGTGQNLMVLPDQIIQKSGKITNIEVVQPATSTGRRNILVFDYDGVNTYTRVGSYPVSLVAGYNSVDVDIDVTAGQVLGLSGLIGTSTTNAPAKRTIFASSGTSLVDGVNQSSNFNWYINVNMDIQVLVADTGSTQSARKRAKIVYGHGQSNMVGQNSAAISGLPYGNLMFTPGLRTLYNLGDRTGISSLMESSTTTGLSLATAYCTELELVKHGATSWSDLDSVFFASCGALSGITVETAFDYDGTVWPNALNDLRAAGDLLFSEGYDPLAAFFVWVHGYSNRNDARGVYAPKLKAGIEKIRGAVANAHGNFFLIAAQMPHHQQTSDTNLPNVALDTKDIAVSVGGEVFPLYPAEWADNGIHMTTKGNVYKGLMIGKMMFDIANGGYQHIRFKVNRWGSSSVVLDLKGGNGSYTFDTASIPAVPNMGFDAFSASGVYLPGVVTGASLNGSQVTLSVSRSLVAGERITYGFGRPGIILPTDSAPGPYHLGNLRDTDSRSKVVSGVTYNLWNWCSIHEVVK